ncbi:MAG: fibronectin type III domain-containing protein [Bacteroidales bacterium]|nr:fibronectin type III domain-containing protein [Bacteroidales bacterium]
MNRFIIIILLCVIGACSQKGTTYLQKPDDLQIKSITENSVAIQWGHIKQATHYLYVLEADIQTEDYHRLSGSTQENSLSFDKLKSNKTYHFQVCGVDQNTILPGGEGGPKYLQSDWSEMDFTTPGG